ncbi:hypothetical protein RCL1_000209 [Eukaryota sp. TZLM3-RCL]
MDVTQLVTLTTNLPLGHKLCSITTTSDQNHRYLFLGSSDGLITGLRISPSLHYTPFFSVVAAKGPIRALAFCKKCNFLFAGSDDGACRIFNPFAVPLSAVQNVLGMNWKPTTGFIQTLSVNASVLALCVVPGVGILISTTDGTIKLFKQIYSTVPALIRTALYEEVPVHSLFPLSVLNGWIPVVKYEQHRSSDAFTSPNGVLVLGDASGNLVILDGEVFGSLFPVIDTENNTTRQNFQQEISKIPPKSTERALLSSRRSRLISTPSQQSVEVLPSVRIPTNQKSKSGKNTKTSHVSITSGAHSTTVVDCLIFPSLGIVVSIGNDSAVGFFSIRTGKSISRFNHPDKLKFICLDHFDCSEFVVVDCQGTVFLFSALTASLIRSSHHSAISFTGRNIELPTKWIKFLDTAVQSIKFDCDLVVNFNFIVSSVSKVKIYSIQVVNHSTCHSNSHTDSIIGIYGNRSGKVHVVVACREEERSRDYDLIDDFDCLSDCDLDYDRDFQLQRNQSLLRLSRDQGLKSPNLDTFDLNPSNVFSSVNPDAFFSVGSDNYLILWDSNNNQAFPAEKWILADSLLEVVCCNFLEEYLAFIFALDSGCVKLFHIETRKSTEIKLISSNDDVIVCIDLMYSSPNSDPFVLVLSRKGFLFVLSTCSDTPWKISLDFQCNLIDFVGPVRSKVEFLSLLSDTLTSKVFFASTIGVFYSDFYFSSFQKISSNFSTGLYIDGSYLLVTLHEPIVSIFDLNSLSKLKDFSTNTTSDICSLVVIPPPKNLESKIETGGLICLLTHDSIQVWHYSSIIQCNCVYFRSLPRYLIPTSISYRNSNGDLLVGTSSGVLVEIKLTKFLEECEYFNQSEN